MASALNSNRTLAAGIALAALLWSGCDEALPSRADPRVLQVSATITSASVLIRNGVVQPGLESGTIRIDVLNAYDEVLEDTALVGGQITASLDLHPEVTRTFTIDRSMIANTGILHGIVITLGVDTAAVLLKSWDHRSVNGSGFWEHVSKFSAVDARGNTYLESVPSAIVFSGSIRLFHQLPALPVRSSSAIVVYKVYGVNSTP